MTRALVITRVLPQPGGGAQLYLLTLLEALAGAGIDVSVLPLRRPYLDGSRIAFRSTLVSRHVPIVSPGHVKIGSWSISRRLPSLVAARLVATPPPRNRTRGNGCAP